MTSIAVERTREELEGTVELSQVFHPKVTAIWLCLGEIYENKEIEDARD